MTAKELYPTLVQLIIHAESVSWNRFYNFLVFSSILVLAWAAVWVSDVPQLKPLILAAISLLGAVSGVFWAALGYRGRTFLFEYVKMASEIEADFTVWANDIEKYKPATRSVELRDSLRYGWAGSRVILVAGPLAFSVLYVIMLVVSLR